MSKRDYESLPAEYRPIGMWGYLGYEILFSIPVLGIIMLIVKAIGAGNVNVRNFARSYFCVLIIAVILFFVCGGTELISAVMANLGNL